MIPGLGRSSGEGKGYPLQYSVLENSMDWKIPSPRGQKESDMTERLHFPFLWVISPMIIYSPDWLFSRLKVKVKVHGLYSPWNSPGQNTGVGSLSLLQRIFPTQGLNPGLPHCRLILYQLSHAEDRLTPRWHVGQPCGKASWESLEGKPQIP